MMEPNSIHVNTPATIISPSTLNSEIFNHFFISVLFLFDVAKLRIVAIIAKFLGYLVRKCDEWPLYDTKTSCFAVAEHKRLKEMWDAYDYNSWLQLCQETAIEIPILNP